MSYIREIWFHCKEESKIFKAMFVLCLYATHSFIFVSNIKMIQRGQRTLHLRDNLFYVRIADTLWSRSVQERHSSRRLSHYTLLSRFTIRKMFCSRYTSERHSISGTYQGYIVIYVCIGEAFFQKNVRVTLDNKNVCERQYVRI